MEKIILLLIITCSFTFLESFSNKRFNYSNRAQALKLLNSDGIRGTWSLPSSMDQPNMEELMPQVKVAKDCIRDTYVSAAIFNAWAAESYYKFGSLEKAEQVAEKMMESLAQADELCSGDVSMENLRASCQTLKSYPCE